MDIDPHRTTMHKFVRSLITEWRKLGLAFTGGTVVVGVSGGADSMALLVAIDDLVKRRKLTHRIIVAHFNHGLRGQESDADERFVRDYAAKFGFEFVTGTAKLANRKGNLEQTARNARYEFLTKVARESDAFAVLTAHTQNDQAETFLFNLIRGSGPEGLGGMKAIRDLEKDAWLIRPLLTWATRSDTESFAKLHKIKFRNDRMNRDERFSRVRIRRTILPSLAEINPKIVEALARTAGLMQDVVQSDQIHHTNGNLPLKALKSLTTPGLYANLRSWLRTRRGSLRSIELKHIEAIERLILSPKSGKTVELPGGGRVTRHRGELSFTNIKVEK